MNTQAIHWMRTLRCGWGYRMTVWIGIASTIAAGLGSLARKCTSVVYSPVMGIVHIYKLASAVSAHTTASTAAMSRMAKMAVPSASAAVRPDTVA